VSTGAAGTSGRSAARPLSAAAPLGRAGAILAVADLEECEADCEHQREGHNAPADDPRGARRRDDHDDADRTHHSADSEAPSGRRPPSGFRTSRRSLLRTCAAAWGPHPDCDSDDGESDERRNRKPEQRSTEQDRSDDRHADRQ
jgi:hypothetical protein